MPPTKHVNGMGVSIQECRSLLAAEKKLTRKLRSEKRKLKTVIKELRDCSMQYFSMCDKLLVDM